MPEPQWICRPFVCSSPLSLGDLASGDTRLRRPKSSLPQIFFLSLNMTPAKQLHQGYQSQLKSHLSSISASYHRPVLVPHPLVVSATRYLVTEMRRLCPLSILLPHPTRSVKRSEWPFPQEARANPSSSQPGHQQKTQRDNSIHCTLVNQWVRGYLQKHRQLGGGCDWRTRNPTSSGTWVFALTLSNFYLTSQHQNED